MPTEYEPPLTLPRIRARIDELTEKIPSVEDTQRALTLEDIPAMEEWCKRVRFIVRNFNLVLNFVSNATYQWAPDRTGNTNQNITALRECRVEACGRLDIIVNHCNRILTPNISTVLRRKVKTVEGTTETETYHYEDVVDDEDLLKLNREQLVQEGMEKRALLLVTMKSMSRSLEDFIRAEENSGGSSEYRSSMAY